MSFLQRLHRYRQTLGMIVVFSTLMAGVFSYLTSDHNLESFIQGCIDGFTISLLLSLYLIVIRNYLTAFRQRFNFTVMTLLETIIYATLFLGGRIIGQYLGYGELQEFFSQNFQESIGFAVLMFMGLSFLFQITRLVGRHELWNFVTGRYHQPVEEERIFMFLDLESSTELAERLGNRAFHQLLNRFYNDITEAIVETGGDIYKYVGDEIIVSWPRQKGLEKSNCLRCFFLIEEKMAREQERYRAAFGTVPRFRAGIHGGPVIAGELGDVKQEIAFLGDVLNTTSRIVSHCRERGQRLLISETVIQSLKIPPGYQLTDEGEFQPRGKQVQLKVYSITPPNKP